MTWDTAQYLKFADHRLRPALDLLARVPVEAPRRVVDLGCGAGNVTAVLASRWSGAEISGLDPSPEMLERGEGSITIISSIGGLKGSPIIGAYGISKAADMQVARNFSVEFGPKGVRVNCIAPGLIRTYMARALWENEENLRRSTAASTLKRIGEPHEIAGAAVFLASKAGAFTTGQTVVCDGGATISGGA